MSPYLEAGAPQIQRPKIAPAEVDWSDPDAVYCYKKFLFLKASIEVRPNKFVAYEPHEGQRAIHFPERGEEWDNFVCSAGQRSGKTIAAALEVVAALGMPGQRVWIIAPTHDLAERCFEQVWDLVVTQGIHGFGSVKKKSNTKDSRYIQMKWGSWVKTKSAENPNSLVGEKLTLAVVDEAAQLGEEIWINYVEPRLVNLKGRAILISSPRGYNWFWKYFQRGLDPEARAEGWRSATFRTADNPWVSKEWLEKKRRLTPTEDWEQEYEGKFISHAGLVYKDYRDELYPKGQLFDPAVDKVDPFWTHFRGIDVGLFHDTAAVWLAVDPDGNRWAYQDYLENGNSHQWHARNIEDLTRYAITTTWISPDSRRTNALTEADKAERISAYDIYNQEGVYVRKANDRVTDGIGMVQAGLRAALASPKSTTDTRLYISKDCKHLRQGLLSYLRQGRSGVQKDEVKSDLPEKPRKYKDDAVDALRYVVAGNPTYIAPQPFYEEEDFDPYGREGNRMYRNREWKYQKPGVDYG